MRDRRLYAGQSHACTMIRKRKCKATALRHVLESSPGKFCVGKNGKKHVSAAGAALVIRCEARIVYRTMEPPYKRQRTFKGGSATLHSEQLILIVICSGGGRLYNGDTGSK